MARTKWLKIRVSDDEVLDIKKRAGRQGMSSYARGLILDQPIAPPEPKPKTKKIVHSADPELVREINRIGININQITRHLNEGQPLSNAILIALLNLQTSLDETVSRTMTNDS